MSFLWRDVTITVTLLAVVATSWDSHHCKAGLTFLMFSTFNQARSSSSLSSESDQILDYLKMSLWWNFREEMARCWEMELGSAILFFFWDQWNRGDPVLSQSYSHLTKNHFKWSWTYPVKSKMFDEVWCYVHLWNVLVLMRVGYFLLYHICDEQKTLDYHIRSSSQIFWVTHTAKEQEKCITVDELSITHRLSGNN